MASLLNLQSRAVHSTEAAGQLTAAASRVSAVARVHRTFAAEPNAERLPVPAYLRRLCGELADILESAVEIDGLEVSIPTQQILFMGLITNELVTNAKKHGAGAIQGDLQDRRSGQVRALRPRRRPGSRASRSIGTHPAASA